MLEHTERTLLLKQKKIMLYKFPWVPSQTLFFQMLFLTSVRVIDWIP